MRQLHCDNLIKINSTKGQVLLATVIVLGVIGMVIASSIILLSLSSFRGILAAQQAAEALGLNNACVEEALYQIRLNNSFVGSNQFIVDGKKCFYDVDNLGGNDRLVNVSTTVGGVVKRTRLILTASSSIDVSSWQEVP